MNHPSTGKCIAIYNRTASITSLVVVFILLMVGCQKPDQSYTSRSQIAMASPEPEAPVPYHADSSLCHKVVKQWKVAEKPMRLANCVAFVEEEIQDITSMSINERNKLADDLLYCIDQSTEGVPTMLDDSVRSVALSCLHAMGFYDVVDFHAE